MLQTQYLSLTVDPVTVCLLLPVQAYQECEMTRSAEQEHARARESQTHQWDNIINT